MSSFKKGDLYIIKHNNNIGVLSSHILYKKRLPSYITKDIRLKHINGSEILMYLNRIKDPYAENFMFAMLYKQTYVYLERPIFYFSLEPYKT